jgi:DNA primase
LTASTKATKGDVVRYYGLVGELMMEHLAGRPVSLLRFPQGINRPGFFQKHLERSTMAGVRQLDQSLDPDHPPLIEIAEPLGLPVGGAVECHRVPYVERCKDTDRQAGSDHFRSGPRQGSRVVNDPGSSSIAANLPHRAGSSRISQDQRG